MNQKIFNLTSSGNGCGRHVSWMSFEVSTRFMALFYCWLKIDTHSTCPTCYDIPPFMNGMLHGKLIQHLLIVKLNNFNVFANTRSSDVPLSTRILSHVFNHMCYLTNCLARLSTTIDFPPWPPLWTSVRLVTGLNFSHGASHLLNKLVIDTAGYKTYTVSH